MKTIEAVLVGVLFMIVCSLFLAFLFTIISDADKKAEQQCREGCEKYEAEYFKYDLTYNDECWCKRGNESLQIW